MNRRDFLQAGAAGVALSAHVAGCDETRPPRVGLIGCGWYGKCDLFRLIQVAPVNVVSLCDVDSRMLEEAAGMVAQRQRSRQRPRTFRDYRDMLRQRDLDIVLVVTPDHWHALQTIAAIEAGCDVWVQKPISVDIAEGQAMVAAARRHRKVVQVGTQRRSTPHLVDAKDRVIRAGLLGRVAHAEVYCYYHMRARDNPPDTDPPDYLDYDLWTGPAPRRPYNRLVHPRGWRAFMEYGNGIVGDMCIHMLDMVRWLLDLGWPRRVSSAGGILVDRRSKANITDTQSATFDFGDKTVVWQHRTWGTSADPDYPWGATIYGERGTLKLSVHRYDFIPAGQGQRIHRDVVMELDQYPVDRTERDLERHVAPAIRQHMRNFLEAIRSRGRPVADIEQGHISTASCVLANLSLQLGRTLTWDEENQCVADDAEANRLLRRPYRTPWVHPDGADADVVEEWMPRRRRWRRR
jgi:predicted dehydrogenase